MKAHHLTVVQFCAKHCVVLETLHDWRPLDANYTFSHVFFGAVLDGITDGIVAWTHHASGLTAFVHLDLLEATRLPTCTRTPKPSTRPQRLSAGRGSIVSTLPRVTETSKRLLAILEEIEY
jgi:hypothetical protein